MKNKLDSACVNTVLQCNRNSKITQLKLQKLLYFISAHYAVENKGNKLLEESFEIWKYGPVMPSVYHEFKHYKGEPILSPAIFAGDGASYFYDEEKQGNRSKLDSIRYISKLYKGHSGFEMSVMTHAKGSPWDMGDPGAKIEVSDMVEYFSKSENRFFLYEE